MDASFLDEGALCIGDEVVHVRPKPKGKNFGNDFCDCVDKANWSKVRDLLRTIFLWQKCNVSGVEPLEVFRMKVPKEVNHPHHVALNDIPTFLKESTCEPIGARGLVTWHIVNGILDLFLGEGVTKSLQVRLTQV